MLGVMRNLNHICFVCRAVIRRRSSASGEVRCSICGGKTAAVGDRFEVPRRLDDHRWRDLELFFSGGGLPKTSSGAVKTLERRDYLRKRVAELSQFSESDRCKEELAEVERELSEYDT